MLDASIQEADDEKLIQRTLDPQNSLNLDLDRELDIGTKDENAIDYADLSDSDLADDEAAELMLDEGDRIQARSHDANANYKSAASIQLTPDGLFEDDVSPKVKIGIYGDLNNTSETKVSNPCICAHSGGESNNDEFSRMAKIEHHLLKPNYPIANSRAQIAVSKDSSLQRGLLTLSGLSSQTSRTSALYQSQHDNSMETLWPQFRQHKAPRFMKLLPPRRSSLGISPAAKLAKPKRRITNNLSIEADNNQFFNNFCGDSSLIRGGTGNVPCIPRSDNDGRIGPAPPGLAEIVVKPSRYAQELAELCYELEAYVTDGAMSEYENPIESASREIPADDIAAKIDFHMLDGASHSASRTVNETNRIDLVELDSNDHNLHLWSDSTFHPSSNTMQEKGFSTAISMRYDISQDAAYNKLKENYVTRVRGIAGHMKVEHSLPALRLQWPFFRVYFERQEARRMHRSCLRLRRRDLIIFSRHKALRRRLLKGKSPQDIFVFSDDLFLNDNCHLALIEYSEEAPMLLSNIGMGSKLINHHRRTTTEDTFRPRSDAGELNILLPQDKSPYEPFGHIDAGQTLSSIQNGMFKAPIFRHELISCDFIMTKTYNGSSGESWYIKNIDHLFVAGQQFPNSDVPGPYSRRVTTASKSRLKMITYRIMRRAHLRRQGIADITKHFPLTTDVQTRQKLKEFIQFDRDFCDWRLRSGSSLPDTDSINAIVSPEEVCFLDSMQAGQQYLRDCGCMHASDNDSDDEAEADDGANEEQNLAPWHISRNFQLATQGKAMLHLHGHGDPTGRGEAFSFIKTSMKGGFRAVGESITDRIQSKAMKDSGGHSYNVARQQQAYEESIRYIWNRQKQSLSFGRERDQSSASEDERPVIRPLPGIGGSLSSSTEGQSAWSDVKAAQNGTNRLLEIRRLKKDVSGRVHTQIELIQEQRVIRLYTKAKFDQEIEDGDLLRVKPGMDKEENERNILKLRKELERLRRSKSRGSMLSQGRMNDNDASGMNPVETGVRRKCMPTQRKCANCGHIGHIKTNKKLCPLLNGKGNRAVNS